MNFEQVTIDDIVADTCPEGGDAANDCEGCVYATEYHFFNGECVRRNNDPAEAKFECPKEVHI